jgi:signal transduction histidine kinase
VFLAHGCFLLALAGTTLAHPPLGSFRDYSFFQTLGFAVPAIASTLWTFGFILMMNQRLGAERLESIDEWRRAERDKHDLAIRNRQLQKAESLARMAGAIAHHSNNHMQAVLSSLEVLEAALPGPAPGGSLAKAKRATERATELARMMRVYLGQAAQDQSLQDLAALCRDHLPALGAALPAQDRLRADLPAAGPVIRANADQIRLALDNLAANAREAMGEAGGALRIGVGTGPAAAIPARNRFPVGWQPQAQDYAWLEVADSGAGIAPEDLEKVCDPFFSTRFSGRGLGLSLVLGIAQAHGGGLTVESRPGTGSAFRIHVPVAGADGAAGDGAAGPPGACPGIYFSHGLQPRLGPILSG